MEWNKDKIIYLRKRFARTQQRLTNKLDVSKYAVRYREKGNKESVNSSFKVNTRQSITSLPVFALLIIILSAVNGNAIPIFAVSGIVTNPNGKEATEDYCLTSFLIIISW